MGYYATIKIIKININVKFSQQIVEWKAGMK